MAMDLTSARTLVSNQQLWPRVRDYLAAGNPMLDFTKPENRLALLDEATQRQIRLWLEALGQASEWATVIDGETVRRLRAEYPGIYPEVFRYLPYFAKYDLSQAGTQPELVKSLLKLKFPEAYTLCYS